MRYDSRIGKSIVSLIVVAGLTACAGDEAPPPHVLRPVRFESVVAGGGARVRTFSGAAQADVETSLSFRIRGLVQRVLVETGDRVEEGQLIAELDRTDYELQVQEAEAALIQAEARARQTDSD